MSPPLHICTPGSLHGHPGDEVYSLISVKREMSRRFWTFGVGENGASIPSCTVSVVTKQFYNAEGKKSTEVLEADIL